MDAFNLFFLALKLEIKQIGLSTLFFSAEQSQTNTLGLSHKNLIQLYSNHSNDFKERSSQELKHKDVIGLLEWNINKTDGQNFSEPIDYEDLVILGNTLIKVDQFFSSFNKNRKDIVTEKKSLEAIVKYIKETNGAQRFELLHEIKRWINFELSVNMVQFQITQI